MKKSVYVNQLWKFYLKLNVSILITSEKNFISDSFTIAY